MFHYIKAIEPNLAKDQSLLLDHPMILQSILNVFRYVEDLSGANDD